MILRDILILIFGAIVSYLLGGISVARIITSRNKEGSIVNNGSGNPGTMNMLRTHGLAMGLSTLFFDALKGVVPSLQLGSAPFSSKRVTISKLLVVQASFKGKQTLQFIAECHHFDVIDGYVFMQVGFSSTIC